MEEVGRMLEIQMPRTLIAVNGSEHVGVMAKELGAKKILILTDVGVMGAGLIDRVKGSLQKEKLTFDIFSGCLASAPLASVRECGKLIEGGQFDLMIAVGGGSVMDTAKVAAIVAAHGGDVSVLFDPGRSEAVVFVRYFFQRRLGREANGAMVPYLQTRQVREKHPCAVIISCLMQ